MIIKENFELIKGVPNILHMSRSELDEVSVDRGPRKIFVMIDLNLNRIAHYTKDRVYSFVSDIKLRDSKLHIVVLPDYSLPVSYNVPTDGVVINLAPLGLNDITDKPGIFDIYALLVYGITFRELASKNVKINERFYQPISNYFYSLLMKLFGKMYGLSGSFTYKINELKFLTSMYILESFFGDNEKKSKQKAAVSSAFNYKQIEDSLSQYNFKTIEGYITSLSKTGVMPNINKHLFTKSIYDKLTFAFLPGFEDISRLVSIMTTSDLKSTSIVPTYISKYNERDFHSILEISKLIFKKSF
jgi:hypothetical protein